MKLARYALKDVNTNKKKQIHFRKGLNTSLREKIITHIYPNFNTMMNRTLLHEDECLKSEGEMKRKIIL
jgi:hypothetical protein